MPRVIPSVVLALVAGLSAGCATTPAQAVAAAIAATATSDPNPVQVQPTVQNKAKAISIAQKEARKHGWPATQVLGATYLSGMWSVSIRRLPKMPGAEATVNVSLDGQVLAYNPGT